MQAATMRSVGEKFGNVIIKIATHAESAKRVLISKFEL